MENFLVKYLFHKKSPPEGIRLHSKEMLQNFRFLLNAQNNCLDILAEMKQALNSDKPYSMSFIRSRSTAMLVNTYKMIRHLLQMTGGRHVDLEDAFTDIQHQLKSILEDNISTTSTTWIIAIENIDHGIADMVGDKMAVLGEVRNRCEILVPSGFAITSVAGRYFLSHNNLQDEINRQLQTLNPENLEELYRACSSIQQFIIRAPLPRELEEAILAAYDTLSRQTKPDVPLAVISSAIFDDRYLSSYDSQYHTELSVTREFLTQAYKEIIASKYTANAKMYRLKRGFWGENLTLGVGCLTMIEGGISGFIYSRNPWDINSSWTLLRYHNRQDGSKAAITGKTNKVLIDRHPPYEKISELKDITELTGKQTEELVQTAVRLEKHFGAPQHIEWIIDEKGRLVILQCRPLHAPSSSDDGAILSEPSTKEEEEPLCRGKVTASPGIATGPVYIVRSNIDLLQFPSGAVLVTPHPLPQWAPLLNNAAALVTETEDIAGDLATLAREYGLPALFGVKQACTKLKNKDLIRVDAGNCRIYSARQENITDDPVKPRNLMTRSPVQLNLKKILQHIAPLNLINPDSRNFKADSCKTLHDIICFCYEKSLLEMFNFGKKHHDVDLTAKKISNKTPDKWLLIDIKNGIRPGTDKKNKSISITDIVSLPMLAMWEGLHAFPRKGKKNYISKLRTVLRKKPLKKWNYFLISKEFCNTSIRRDSFFSMSEAVASERHKANYITFHISCLISDNHRKALHLHLLSDILQNFGFRTYKNENVLNARLTNEAPELIWEKLKVLGYLIMNTGLNELTLTGNSQVKSCRDQLLNDIDVILAKNSHPATNFHH